MNRHEERAQAFVTWLQEHGEDRGLMAELRRGLGRDTEWMAWKHLARWCDLTRKDQRVAYATVGGGFAAHPKVAARGNLGDTMRDLAKAPERDGGGAVAGRDPLASFEGRFSRLLTCDSVAEVAERVGAVVRAAKPRAIPVNYQQLLVDLLEFRWPERRERTKLRWAQSFWGSQGEVAQSEETG